MPTVAIKLSDLAEHVAYSLTEARNKNQDKVLVYQNNVAKTYSTDDVSVDTTHYYALVFMKEIPKEETCPVCLDEFEDGAQDAKTKCITTCGHSFHKGCLQQVVTTANADGQLKCPMCRKKLSFADGIVTCLGEPTKGFDSSWVTNLKHLERKLPEFLKPYGVDRATYTKLLKELTQISKDWYINQKCSYDQANELLGLLIIQYIYFNVSIDTFG